MSSARTQTIETMAKQLTSTEGRPTHEEISERAKLIYEQNGRQPGHDLDNWLQAEAQLMAARKRVNDRPSQPQPAQASLVKVAAHRQ